MVTARALPSSLSLKRSTVEFHWAHTHRSQILHPPSPQQKRDRGNCTRDAGWPCVTRPRTRCWAGREELHMIAGFLRNEAKIKPTRLIKNKIGTHLDAFELQRKWDGSSGISDKGYIVYVHFHCALITMDQTQVAYRVNWRMGNEIELPLGKRVLGTFSVRFFVKVILRTHGINQFEFKVKQYFSVWLKKYFNSTND